MSAAEIVYGLPLAFPEANPFLLIGSTFRQRLYPTMSAFYMNSMIALHVLFLLQALVIAAALVILWRHGDLWFFKRTSTSRGTYIVPHFQVAWQFTTILSIAGFQPIIASIRDHANGKDWAGYIGGRSMCYIPAWITTWLALWSLAVAVSLPRVNGSAAGRFSFFSSALALNIHFIGGPIFGCFAIVVPSSLSGIHYDIAITHYTKMTSMLEDYAPRFANMTTSDSALALSKLEVVIQPMLDELDFFSMSYKVSWIIWTSIILYTYSIFICVAILYFRYIRTAMSRLAAGEGRYSERLSLRRSWWFSICTSLLLTVMGVVFGAATLYLSVWTNEGLTVPLALEIETLGAFYGFAVMGSFGAILALVQSSTTANPHVLASALTPTQSSRPSRFSSSKIRVEIETETKHEVDSRSMPNVVALELADWKARAEDGKAQPGWA